eukprot:Platyproteum_vivax@DN10446_c0_g1_i1.p1
MKAKLIQSIEESQFTRCGRTDKGVSAAGNYYSLRMRLKKAGVPYNYSEVLNRLLPTDIRILNCAPAPDNFNCRHSCVGRIYKYFFLGDSSLNVSLMDEAAKKFIGSHDFRNFCKMDLQKSNFVREVQSVTFSRCSNSQSCWVATIQGRSFLWHQVRSMMSLLFM